MKPTPAQLAAAIQYVDGQPWPWSALVADRNELIRTIAALIAEREAAALVAVMAACGRRWAIDVLSATNTRPAPGEPPRGRDGS